MNSFSDRIRNIEARINRLKTLSLSSSSSLAVSYTTITMPFQIVATRITAQGEIMDCDSSKVAYVGISTADDAPALISLRLISPTSFGDRIIISARTIQNIGGHKYGYKFRIGGDDNDLQILRNGGTLPVVNYTFKIVATSSITYSITYEDFPIQHD